MLGVLHRLGFNFLSIAAMSSSTVAGSLFSRCSACHSAFYRSLPSSFSLPSLENSVISSLHRRFDA
jgi:hypothetical protein